MEFTNIKEATITTPTDWVCFSLVPRLPPTHHALQTSVEEVLVPQAVSDT